MNYRPWIFCLIVLLSPSLTYAQADPVGTAYLNEGVIVLDLSPETLFEKWQIDIADSGFESQQAVQAFFDHCTDNLLRYEIYWSDRKVLLILALEYQPNWVLADWNTYILTKTTGDE